MKYILSYAALKNQNKIEIWVKRNRTFLEVAITKKDENYY